MKKIRVNKKTGFLITKSPVTILDRNKRLFYSNKDLKKNVRAFNLPAGEYYIDDGSIKPLNSPVVYNYFELPPPERFFRANPMNFEITFGDTPDKCNVLWKDELILFDRSMKKLTFPELYFILCHEYGHQKYSTEKYCDLFAANCMLKKGFNPSQIGKAILNALSDRTYHRKQFIINKILSL